MIRGKKRKQGFDLIKTIKTIEKAMSTAMKIYKTVEPIAKAILGKIK
jgi:hypothetical protein